PSAEAYQLGRTLAAWFGVTLIVLLLLSVIGLFFTRRRPWRRSSGWWFLAAGLVCLLGSQLILFPVAFVCFVAAGCFALRPISDGSPSEEHTSELQSRFDLVCRLLLEKKNYQV